ncbi:MAG: discoidin domain-containing protein [Dictyoglomus sp.]|nr:discoidin domain-containing protein [Dictyoglomus sp.]MDW8188984.1 discoidin domain-containing protein [Dictyoglomus sp.]
MIKRIKIISFFIFLLLLLGTNFAQNLEKASDAKLIIYEAPKTMKPAQGIKVKVGGHEVFVYDIPVNPHRRWLGNNEIELSSTPMCYFDFSGGIIRIEITKDKEIKSCNILPSSFNIIPNISGKNVTFFIRDPGFYTVIFDDSPENALHIFANPIEENIPDKNDPNVIFIEPGEWIIDNIPLQSGQTLYLSGGAVLHTSIHGIFLNNITIKGRGIIDGSIWKNWLTPGEIARVPINLRNSKGITIEGIIITNPNAWALNLYECENTIIKNVKIITARQNGDGITIQSSRNIHVSDSFVRSWDDSLVIKNYAGDSKFINFNNIQIWTDLAQSMEIGYETNKGMKENPIISDISFRDITVLYNFHKPVISIHNSDNALVKNIYYENIIVENALMGEGDAGENNQLIDFAILSSQWSSTKERGNVRNVYINNVKVLKGKFPPSRIIGYDENHTIENVNIKNLVILGKEIKSLEEGRFKINPFVKNINITQEKVVGKDFLSVPKTIIEGNGLVSPENLLIIKTPEQKEAEIPEKFKITQVIVPEKPSGENVALKKPISASSYQDVYMPRYAVDGRIKSYWEGKANTYPNIVIVDLQKECNIHTIRIALNPDKIWSKRVQTFEIKFSLDGETYKVLVPKADYIFDPMTSNIVDIKLPKREKVRYIQIIFYANTGATGGQIGELEIYE